MKYGFWMMPVELLLFFPEFVPRTCFHTCRMLGLPKGKNININLFVSDSSV